MRRFSCATAFCFLIFTALVTRSNAGEASPGERVEASNTSAALTESELSKRLRSFEPSFVPPQAEFAAVIHPKRVLTSPEMEMLPIEVVSAASKRELGFDLLQIETMIVVAKAPQFGSPPQIGIVVRSSLGLPMENVFPPLVRGTVLSHQGFRRARGPRDLSFMQIDARTVLAGHQELLGEILVNRVHPNPGPASRLLVQAEGSPDVIVVLAVEPLRPMLSTALSHTSLPPPLAGIKKVPELVSSIEAKGNLIGNPGMSLTVRARDEAAARELEVLVGQWLTHTQRMIAAELDKQHPGDPIEQALQKYAKRILDRTFEASRPQRKDDTLMVSTYQQQATAQAAKIGAAVALLLPFIQAARETAGRSQTVNHLARIGAAMQMHRVTKGVFPCRASFDDRGKPLLSWRVHLLPHLGQGYLYQQFRLDEPWDSKHNRALIPLMPPVYQNPSGRSRSGTSQYLGVVGTGLFFDGSKQRKLADIADGAGTIMIVEVDADRAVTWTKPDDWESDPDHLLDGLGNAHPGGFSALFVDGSVRFLFKSIDPQAFRALLTVAGGEDVDKP